MFYVLKPLTMVLICLTAILGGSDLSVYKVMIIGGLVCSLAGDIFLMLPADRFLPGLIAFLFAHLCYITAFAADINELSWWPLIPLIIWGIGFYLFISPSLGKLKIPVIFYVVIILVMTWLAWERWIQTGQIETQLVLIGAVLFVISDTILAANRFKGAFKPAQALNLATYFAAQWLIASSVGMLVL
ncbi:MAG: lysoplasmalogenase [Anaerolineales bacterium]|nr:lysoplasmalogenase [Anaerolineales bacterium]